jgi:hypothetical protein
MKIAQMFKTDIFLRASLLLCGDILLANTFEMYRLLAIILAIHLSNIWLYVRGLIDKFCQWRHLSQLSIEKMYEQSWLLKTILFVRIIKHMNILSLQIS